MGICEECDGTLSDGRARWHRWCGPPRRGGLPIERPPAEVMTDAQRAERVKVIYMDYLEMAAAAGDGNLVARLASIKDKVLGHAAPETGMAAVLAAVGEPAATQPELFAVS